MAGGGEETRSRGTSTTSQSTQEQVKQAIPSARQHPKSRRSLRARQTFTPAKRGRAQQSQTPKETYRGHRLKPGSCTSAAAPPSSQPVHLQRYLVRGQTGDMFVALQSLAPGNESPVAWMIPVHSETINRSAFPNLPQPAASTTLEGFSRLPEAINSQSPIISQPARRIGLADKRLRSLSSVDRLSGSQTHAGQAGTTTAMLPSQPLALSGYNSLGRVLEPEYPIRLTRAKELQVSPLLAPQYQQIPIHQQQERPSAFSPEPPMPPPPGFEEHSVYGKNPCRARSQAFSVSALLTSQVSFINVRELIPKGKAGLNRWECSY